MVNKEYMDKAIELVDKYWKVEAERFPNPYLLEQDIAKAIQSTVEEKDKKIGELEAENRNIAICITCAKKFYAPIDRINSACPYCALHSKLRVEIKELQSKLTIAQGQVDKLMNDIIKMEEVIDFKQTQIDRLRETLSEIKESS